MMTRSDSPWCALGLDEVLVVREGEYHRQQFSTQVVDVARGQLLDVVPGRSGVEPTAWLSRQGPAFLAHVAYDHPGSLGPYRAVFDKTPPYATQVADPPHVVKLANQRLDECRRRVQNEASGHRGHKTDPLYTVRRMLTMAAERLDVDGKQKLLGLTRPAAVTAACRQRGAPINRPSVLDSAKS